MYSGENEKNPRNLRRHSPMSRSIKKGDAIIYTLPILSKNEIPNIFKQRWLVCTKPLAIYGYSIISQ